MNTQEKLERLSDLKSELNRSELDAATLELLTAEQQALRTELYAHPDPWTKVQIARYAKRPNAHYFIQAMFTDLIELHGDRQSGDDNAMYGALGRFLGMPVTILAQRKGSNLQENLACNFGMNSPEGYRKALRLMKQAEKFGRPILTFVDTPGAYPGISAEEKGQGEAIARNLMEMSQLKVPIITFVLGEGGSGGALALSICDKMMMLEHAVYSILSPEGFSSILYKDASRAAEAANVMKMTAQDLYSNGFVDIVVPEPEEGIHIAPEKVVAMFTQHLREELILLRKQKIDALLANRYERLRKFGEVPAMSFTLLGLGAYLPAGSFSNEDMAKIVDTNHEWIHSRSGIANRRYVTNENTHDLALQAAAKALADAKIDPLDVDAILVATFTPSALIPSVACLVADALGCREDILAFDMNGACSGFIYGLETAHALLSSGKYKHILVIGAEVISKVMDFNDRRTCILFGDGAGAALVTNEGTGSYLWSKAYRKSDVKHSLYAPGIALNNPLAKNEQKPQVIGMDGTVVFQFAIEAIHQAIRDFTLATGMTLDELDHVVLHQANQRITAHIMKTYKQKTDKFVSVIEDYGNTSAASIPIALDTLKTQDKLKSGDKILMIGFGGGLTYGAFALTV